MLEGLRRLYTGEFNVMEQAHLPDGSVIVTLCKSSEDKTYRFRVKDLYGEHEEVLEHEVIKHEIPKHITDRMKEAKKWPRVE